MKQCSKCKITKEKAAFHKNKAQKDGHHNWCKRCDHEQRLLTLEHRQDKARKDYYKNRDFILSREKERRSADPRYGQAKDLWKYHKITIEDYDTLYISQGGLCAICRQPEKDIHNITKRPKQLAVDHNHTTGKIRGLLCGRCNKGIGLLQESLELLDAAKAYLIKNKIA